MTVFAFTHSQRVKTQQRLRDLERHGLRQDRLAKENLRDGAVPGTGIDWPDFNGRRLTKAYAAFKKRNDVAPRKGAQLLHSIGVGVSPSWIRTAGDLHDPQNPRNVQVFQAAIAWVKSFAGDDAIVSARMDLDERGGGWVDVYFAPIRQQKYKGRSTTKPVISVNKCLEETAVSLGYPKGSHYSALNSSWAMYVQQHLDPAIERGEPGRDTLKEHLTPRQFKAKQEWKKKAAAAEVAEQTARHKEMELEANANALLAIFTDPELEKLEPRPQNGRWKAPNSIVSKVNKLGQFKTVVLKVLNVLAIKSAELRERLDKIVRREKQLGDVLVELERVKDRLTAEDLQAVERGKAVARHAENAVPTDESSPW